VSDGPRLAIFGPVPGSRFSVYQVPILDMINHRNGKWKNVESTTAHAGKDIRVYALRNIEKGEQLWSECVLRLCLFSFLCIVDYSKMLLFWLIVLYVFLLRLLQ